MGWGGLRPLGMLKPGCFAFGLPLQQWQVLDNGTGGGGRFNHTHAAPMNRGSLARRKHYQDLALL